MEAKVLVGDEYDLQCRMMTLSQRVPALIFRLFFALVLVSGMTGCGGPRVDLGTALEVEDITTGWLDVGVDDYGRNKLVPTLSFRLSNVSM